MAGVKYFNIEQIPTIPYDNLMIAIGTVLSVSFDENFFSMYISDFTATAEATFYQPKVQYEQMPIPQVGDTIQVLGTCLTKSFINKKKLFLKIIIKRWRTLDFQQQLELMQIVAVSRINREKQKIRNSIPQIQKIVPIKQKVFSDAQLVDIRSIIFSYTYTVIKNNKDVTSLLFAVFMVKQHSVCRHYMFQNQIPDKSMEEALKQGIRYLLLNRIIEQHLPQASEISLNKPDQYVIKRRYFERLVVDIEEFVYERSAKGTTLNQVTQQMNERMNKLKEKDYLFNQKFIQKVLMDLIDEFRIYETSESMLFPYN